MPDPKLIAFYLPQYHPIPENDVWWGAGFTDWRNVARARPRFKGHYQPHLPADLGFCDLRVPETRVAQADLARAHGIHGFCYYHYWFDGRRLLDRPLREVHESGSPDFPFCVCWANENWTRRWDGQDKDVLIAQNYSADADRRLIADLAPLFRDPRYIRVGGRPLFVVYRADLLPDPRASALRYREQARREGIDDLYLAFMHVQRPESPDIWGFDARIEFPPHDLDLADITPAMENVDPQFKARSGTTSRAPRQRSRARCPNSGSIAAS